MAWGRLGNPQVVDRPPLALQRPHAGVGVEAYDQPVAPGPRLAEVGHVALVEDDLGRRDGGIHRVGDGIDAVEAEEPDRSSGVPLV